MRRYNNIPEAIRKGIFCFMTGSMVFFASETVAEAKEGDNNSSSEAETDNVNTPSEDASSEAANLIDLPEEPTTTKSETQETETGTITETENTYIEQTDNGVAVTEETTVEVVNDTESLTKDKENVTTTTEITETTNDDGTVTTTETTTTTGEYVEDAASTETNSVTDIATSDQNLAEEVVAQVEEAKKHNTENEGIELVYVSEHSFIDNGQEDQKPVELTENQAAELANVRDGAEIVVETTNGASTVSIDGQDVQLSDDLKDIIVDSAKDNVVDESTTHSIGDTQVSEEDLSSLSQDVKDGNTEFTVTTDNDGTSVTYNDAEGNTHNVEDENLQNIISNAAETVSEKTETQELKYLDKEFKGEDDEDLDTVKKVLEEIGYTDFSLVDGTGTYKTGEIEPLNYKDEAAANAKAAELNSNENYSNADVTSVTTTASIEEEECIGLTPEEAASAVAALRGKGYTTITVTNNYNASSDEASSIKKELEDAGFTGVEIVNNGDGTYKVTVQKSYDTVEAANSAKETLEEKEFAVNVTASTTEKVKLPDTEVDETFSTQALLDEFLNNHKDYTLETTYSSESLANAAKDDLKNNYNIDATVQSNEDGSYSISFQVTFDDATDANNLISALKAAGYSVPDAPETSTVATGNRKTIGTYSSYTDAKDAFDALDKSRNPQLDPVVQQGTGTTTVLEDFNGFEQISEDEYNRIKDLSIVDGYYYYYDESSGETIYYKILKENYNIIADNAVDFTNNHQEGSSIIAKKHLIDNNWDPTNPNDTAHNVNFTNEYTPDFTEFIDERTAILTNAGDRTDNTIAWQEYKGQPNYGKQVINITEEGTYFIDGSVPGNSDGRIYVSTSEKVNIILYNYNTDTNGNKYVTIPIVTNSSDYQTVETDHDKPASWEIKPNITFVTEGTDVRIELQGENNIGNVLAPQQTVHLNDGNYCGTIICDTISGVAEGHKNDAGITAYYVDRRRVTTGDIISYVVTADEVTTKYSVSGEKDFFSARVTGCKEGYKQYLSAEKNVNLQDVKVTEYKVTADTMAKTKRLIAKRDVTTTIKKATLTKTDYSKTKTSFDRTYAIKIRRYSKNSERATWTETTTKVIPPETPETPPETPETPETPPETPETPDTPVTPETPVAVPTPDENPTVPVIIIDDDTPLAAEVAQVLGARRVSAAQPMVLGARRGKTGDSTSNPLMATLMIMGASATAMGVLSSKKKKKKG